MSTKNILVLGFTSELNRGDAALQEGLIKLLLKFHPDASVSIVTRFGANQSADFPTELDHTTRLPVKLLGGLIPTFYPLGKSESKPEQTFEFINMLFFPYALLIMLLIWLGTPLSWLGILLPGNVQESLYALRDADLVVIKGRNIRSRGSQLVEFYRTFMLFYHPLLCHRLGKRLVCIGASVWPLKSPLSRWLARIVLDHCEFISVRESNSLEALSSIVGPETMERVHLLPDLSFAACEHAEIVAAKRKPLRKDTYPHRVAVTLVDWGGNGKQARENYILSIVHVLQFLIRQGAKIKIIPQVVNGWEDFSNIWGEIQDRILPEEKNQIENLSDKLNVDELLEQYGQADLLIATRMHSAIFAGMTGTPFVAIPYDSGGKWGILASLGYAEYIIPYKDVTPATLQEKIISCWQNRKNLVAEARNKIPLYREKVQEHVSVWAKK